MPSACVRAVFRGDNWRARAVRQRLPVRSAPRAKDEHGQGFLPVC